jgi:hypothetical protein
MKSPSKRIASPKRTPSPKQNKRIPSTQCNKLTPSPNRKNKNAVKPFDNKKTDDAINSKKISSQKENASMPVFHLGGFTNIDYVATIISFCHYLTSGYAIVTQIINSSKSLKHDELEYINYGMMTPYLELMSIIQDEFIVPMMENIMECHLSYNKDYIAAYDNGDPLEGDFDLTNLNMFFLY